MKTVCEECNGDLKKVTSFTTKICNWGENSTEYVEIFQCTKCKTIFEKKN